MKLFKVASFIAIMFFISANSAFAAEGNIANFTSQTLNTLIILATLGATFFIIKGGYSYITSVGKPDAIEHAKLTIRNAVLGLVLVLGASLITSLLTHAFNTPTGNFTSSQIALSPIIPATPSNGLTQVLLDAIAGFLQI
jgi:hypothetical protein